MPQNLISKYGPVCLCVVLISHLKQAEAARNNNIEVKNTNESGMNSFHEKKGRTH